MLHIRVYAVAREDVNLRRLEGIISAVKPAHIPHTLEIVPAVAPHAEDS
jgi:hypothetical protein